MIFDKSLLRCQFVKSGRPPERDLAWVLSPDIADIRILVVNLTSDPDKGPNHQYRSVCVYHIPQPSDCEIVASLSAIDIGDMLVVNLISGPGRG